MIKSVKNDSTLITSDNEQPLVGTTPVRGVTSGALMGLAALAVAPQVAATTTYTVNFATDTSLRAAVALANGHTNDSPSDPDVINLSGLTDTTILLTSGELFITDSVIVTGPGADSLRIDPATFSRIFRICKPVTPGSMDCSYNPSSPITVTISGLTLQHGLSEFGGAIQSVSANLTLNDCHLQDNTTTPTTDTWGGALYVYGGSATVSDSIITGNTATKGGGGIYAYSLYQPTNLSIIDSRITGNTANTREGGGIYFGGGQGGTSTLTIERSTISGNQSISSSGGGGIFIGYAGGYAVTALIDASTISGNSSTNNGGGIAITNTHVDSSVTLTNVTVADNSATVTGGGISLKAGNQATLTAYSSTIAGNSAATTGGISNLGVVAHLQNTIVGLNGSDLTAGAFTANYSLVQSEALGGTNIQAAPLLANLGDYGGSTCTRVPLEGSPALDAGNPGFTPPTGDLSTTSLGQNYDQRGSASDPSHVRVATSPYSGGILRMDIGAVELLNSEADVGDGIFKNGFDDNLNGYAITTCN